MSSPSDARADQLLQILGEFARDSRLSIPPAGLTLDIRLESDLGLDSLARSELIGRVERGMGASLPEEALLASTARDLLGMMLAARLPGSSLKDVSQVPLDHQAGSPEAAASLLDVLDWHLAHHPDRTHILFYAGEGQPIPISYADLDTGARRVATLLRGEGLRGGKTVAIMLPTGPEYFFSFFGILMAGGIPVPIYPPARPEQIEDHLTRHARILENAGSVYLITVAQARTVARLLRAKVPCLKDVMTLDGLEEVDAEQSVVSPRAEDIAFIQYTSGSTGDPKGVVLSHADLLANVRAMGEAAEVRPDDVFVSWLPLYHDMGLIGAWLGSLYFGLLLVSMSPLAFLSRPQRWLEAIQAHRGTLSAAPNFAYELCLKRIADADLEQLDLSSWRWAFNGAEPVSPSTLSRFCDRFAPCGFRREALAPVYGLAEAAVGLAFPPLGRGPRIDCIERARFARHGHALSLPCDESGVMQVVACGKPLPGYRIRVVDGRGRELPERHEGHLQFQGPSATRGYYRRPDATAQLIRDGWLETGDRAYLADGDIYLTGRVKDLIIRGGRNVYPYELEQAVGEIEGIRKGCVAVFAAADADTGSERLVVVAETRERELERRKALETEIRERTGDVLGMPPDEVVLAPPRAVPKTSSGKLRRGSTRELFLAGRLSSGPGSPLWQILRVGAGGLWAMASRTMRGLPAYLYGGYFWLVLALLTPWVWVGVVLLPDPAWRWVLVRGGIRALRSLAGVGLRVDGIENLPPPGQAFVLVANHQSYLDAMALIETIPRPLAFIAKRELLGNRWAGRFLRRLGTLFVDRFDPRSGSGEAESFTSALDRGDILAFFPEGTFRDGAGLLPFRMGAFVAAAANGLPILPVSISGTRQIMTGDHFLPRSGDCRLAIGPPLQPDGQDWQAAAELRDGARTFILEACGEPDLDRRSQG